MPKMCQFKKKLIFLSVFNVIIIILDLIVDFRSTVVKRVFSKCVNNLCINDLSNQAICNNDLSKQKVIFKPFVLFKCLFA